MASSAQYWEDRAVELSRTSLDTIRSSATTWAATTTALLGVFGTVTVVAGPSSLSDLDGSTKDIVAVLIIAAAVVATVSVLATGYASRGPAKKFTPLNGMRLAKWTVETTRKANVALWIGRLTGVAAALIVLAAGSVAIIGETNKSSAPPPSYLVRTTSGALNCGSLKLADGKLELANGAGATILDLSSGVAAVASVASCPSG